MEKNKIKERLKNNSVKGLFAILIVVVIMFSLVPLAALATNTISTDTTDSSDVKVTTKAKAASIKVTWNGNGGKLGTKKTKVNNVKKGSKIGKLLVTPKRTGYTFKGWYTKKTGGKKITKNTKVSKKVIYYAQWKTKASSSSNGIDSKIVGVWKKGYLTDSTGVNTYKFDADGKFFMMRTSKHGTLGTEGKYYTSGGKVFLTNLVYIGSDGKKPVKDKVSSYSFGIESGREYILINAFSYTDEVSDSGLAKYYKSS